MGKATDGTKEHIICEICQEFIRNGAAIVADYNDDVWDFCSTECSVQFIKDIVASVSFRPSPRSPENRVTDTFKQMNE